MDYDENKYDYLAAEFDGFLNRSVENVEQYNLSAPGTMSRQMKYDAASINGMLGDTIQIGAVSVRNYGITLEDNGVNRLLIGIQRDGF